jgi:SAM-dependent methyltransferase
MTATATATAIEVYQDALLRTATEEAIRPGGLDLTDRAVALAALPRGAVVLDVGCGCGVTVRHLRERYGLAALGVDPSALLLASGRTRSPELPVLRGRSEHLPMAAASVDAVLLECVLSVVDDLDAALAEVARVLRPGGLLVVTDLYARNPDAAAQLLRLPVGSCLRGCFVQQQLLDRLAAHGFLLRRWEDHSATLTRLAVELVWQNGSEAGLRCAALGAGDRDEVRAATRRARPGYFLLTASTPGG